MNTDFSSKIIKYMRLQNYFIAEGKNKFNIVYVEGANENGTPNADSFNKWNDRRLILEVLDGKPSIIGNWLATTEPGSHYTFSPMNANGAARIAFGQYQCWQIGTHGNSEPHEALVQTAGAVKVHRDLNKDGFRTGDKIQEGWFGINQHYGYDMPEIGRASAGCLVGQSRQGHREFMALIKKDVRYLADKSYPFMTTIIPGDKLNFDS